MVTPVVRRRFDSKGRFYDVHGRYPDAVREVGVEMNVPVIDLNKMRAALVEDLGQEGSKDLYLWIPEGMFSGFPGRRTDNTHFSWRGARAMASLVVQGIRQLDSPLKNSLASSAPGPSVGMEKLVLLDYHYNNEWRKDKAGRAGRYHYIWEDTTNSGFSIVGSIIASLGAELDSLETAPTKEDLHIASVYIIVDPDTPKETASPQSIGEGEARVIEDWVRDGGVLVLMANDSGNCDFGALNRLAQRFGITFNEDSRNRVRGTDYDIGRVNDLPNHPIFADVSSLFLKEISSLSIAHPARSILTAGEFIILAESRIGQGMVVAIGDPWLYNEYIDNRRLPPGYENRPAALAFFRWILPEARTVR